MMLELFQAEIVQKSIDFPNFNFVKLMTCKCSKLKLCKRLLKSSKLKLRKGTTFELFQT